MMVGRRHLYLLLNKDFAKPGFREDTDVPVPTGRVADRL